MVAWFLLSHTFRNSWWNIFNDFLSQIQLKGWEICSGLLKQCGNKGWSILESIFTGLMQYIAETNQMGKMGLECKWQSTPMYWFTCGCPKHRCHQQVIQSQAQKDAIFSTELSSVNGSSASDPVLTLGGYSLHLPLRRTVPKDRERHLSSLAKMGSSSVGKTTLTRPVIVIVSWNHYLECNTSAWDNRQEATVVHSTK